MRRSRPWLHSSRGVIFARYVLQIEPVASAPAEDVVRLLSPALRQMLEPRGAS